MPLKMFAPHAGSKAASVRSVIAIAAGKGGVGKSTLTVNLGLALKHLGYQVGIMDTDIYGPSIRKMLPEDRMPLQKGATLIPALCNGIKMISMAYFRKENEAAVVRAPIANGIVTQFIKNVDWGTLDYLLIDFPPGTGDVQLTLSQQASLTGALMVTTPQEVAVMDVRKAMHMFEQVKVPILGVVENMSYYRHSNGGEIVHLFGKGGGERLARASGVPFLGTIPIDSEISRCGDNGLSLFSQAEPSNETVKSFLEAAEKTIEQVQLLRNQEGGSFKGIDLRWKDMGQS